MSQDDLLRAAGRAVLDPAFLEQLHRAGPSAPSVLASQGFVLDPGELQILGQAVGGVAAQQGEARFQQEMAHKHVTAQFERATELGKYTVQILKDTLNTARQAYRVIKWMTVAMFSVGLGLFLAAAVVSLITDEPKNALVFGGLGGATFVALFLTGPIDQSQNALSNLVQAEILFMNYFEQITFWETFAFRQEGMPPGPSKDNIEKASQVLQERTSETSALLQKYVETRGAKRAGLFARRRPSPPEPAS